MTEKPQRRISWSRWGGLGLLALLLLLVLGHAVWQIVAGRSLRERVEELQRSGEPMLPHEFAPINPDSPDNAGTDILAATELLDTDLDEAWKSFHNKPIALPLRPDERKMIASFLTRADAALQKLEQARSKSRMEMPLDLTSPVMGKLMFTAASGLRTLCNLHVLGALLDHERGRDDSSVQRLDRVIFFSRFAEKHPTLIGHLVASGCAALAAARAVEISPDLRVGSKPGAAAPDDLRRLIDLLLDDGPADDGLRLAFRGERMMQLDTMQALANGLPINAPGGPAVARNPFSRYALRPVAHRSARVMIEQMTGLIAVVGEPNYPAARARIPTRQQGGSPVSLFADILLPSLDRAVEVHYRVMTDRRLAATALAIRWYAVEHDGQLPQALNDLVPRYLPAIPLDPLAAGGRIGYRPDPAAPLLYSVGADAKDDDASTQPSKPMQREPDEWEMKDRIIRLTRQPRPEPEGETD